MTVRVALTLASVLGLVDVAAAQEPAWVEPWMRADRKWLVAKAPSEAESARARQRYAEAATWLDGAAVRDKLDGKPSLATLIERALEGGDAATQAAAVRAIEAFGAPFAAIELELRQHAFGRTGGPGPASVPFVLTDGSTSQVHVELPVNYEAGGTARFPLLLTLHGSGEPPEPRRDRFARLLRDRGWIVAAPLSTPNQMRGWGSSAAERAVPLRALQALLARYAVAPDRVVLNGFSMGANGTWEVGMLHRDRFAGLAADAGGPRFRCFPFLGNVAGLPIRANLGSDEDPLLRQAVSEAVAFLQGAIGGPVVHTLTPNVGHDEPQAWLDAMAAWIDDLRRDGYPRALCHHFAALEQGRHHWVQALTLDGKALDATTGRIPVKADPDPNQVRANYVTAGRTGSARIVARVDGQTIEIETRHVPKLAVFLSDRLCDLDQKVFIKVNGRTAWSGIPTRSVAQMLDEVRTTGDVGRIYAARVDVRGR